MDNQDARFLDLLRKWQSGDFTRSDEREMDALTQGDDFRRETWEGFAAQPDAEHEQNLTALRLRLRQRVGLGQTRRIGGLPMIWAAAASLVLLVAAVLFFQKNATPDAAATIADNAAPSAVAENQFAGAEAKGAISAVAPDSTTFSSSIASAEPSPFGKTLAGPGSEMKSRAALDQLTDYAPTPATPAPAAAPAADDLAVASESVADMKKAEQEEAAPMKDDRMPADQSTRPIILRDSKTEQPAGGAADKQPGRIVSAESVKKKAATPPAAKPTPPAPSSAGDTAWNKTGTPPDMAKRRKEARDAALPAQSEPADGWEAFQEYIRQTARLTPAARTKGVSGTVRLRFTVSENGDLQGFVTLRSVGYGCDQEAVRLVKDWVWVRGQNPAVTVEIPFVR